MSAQAPRKQPSPKEPARNHQPGLEYFNTGDDPRNQASAATPAENSVRQS